jgi:tetratricopeptide (TPR) repeat protein
MLKSNHKACSGVLMSKAHRGKIKFSRRTGLTIAIVLGVGLVSLGAGLLAYVLQTGGVKNANGNDSGLIGLPDHPQSKSVLDAQKLNAKGSYDQAQKTLSSAIANSTNSTEKQDLYLEQGVTYENQKNYAQAIDAYNHAAAIKETVAIDEAIARVAVNSGNKQLAIDSYNKAIKLLKPDSARDMSMKQYYEAQIKELSK